MDCKTIWDTRHHLPRPCWIGCVAWSLIVFATVGRITAQDASNEAPDELRSGLVAVYRGQDGTPVERVEASLAFDGSSRRPADDAKPEPVRVAWRGLLKSQTKGSYQLHVYLTGDVRIRLAGQTVLEAKSESEGSNGKQPVWKSTPAIELPFDWHPLEVDFQGTGPQSRIALFWSGPGFQREPLGPRQLFHQPDDAPNNDLARGETLTRLLRCAACHDVPGQSRMAAPALDQLAGNLRADWLTGWLTAAHHPDNQPPVADPDRLDLTVRRMPRFQLDSDQAAAIAAFLLHSGPPAKPLPKPAAQATSPATSPATSTATSTSANKPTNKPGSQAATKPDSRPDPLRGEQLFVTIGCLACHRLDKLGTTHELSGGDLSRIAEKRPADFFQRLLERPESVNRNHRMPQFELAAEQRTDLAAYLATRQAARPGGREEAQAENAQADKTQAVAAPQSPAAVSPNVAADRADRDPGAQAKLAAVGARLFREYRCHACHEGPADDQRMPIVARPIAPADAGADADADADADAEKSACWQAHPSGTQPHYALGDRDRKALLRFWSEIQSGRDSAVANLVSDAEWLVREKNCLACHARGEQPGIAAGLANVSRQFPDLAGLVPALTPPPLDSVGDKLLDSALGDAIARSKAPRRPWLLVQMPRFQLDDRQLQALVQHFVTVDRIPAYARELPAEDDPGVARTVGARLVTTDGFGCTSCHQVGSVEPPQAPLNAKGPDLSGLGQRIRPAWFDRWVRNPARIVPRMEMPSVQLAVRGVLDDDLDRQLSLVWHVLNQPGFEPPLPNPVRVARQTGADLNERAVVITDVVETPQGPFIKPLLVGLANRHNVLYDLQSARLAAWNVGDVARQRTKGKSWFWELAGAPVWQTSQKQEQPDDGVWQLQDGDQSWSARRTGQFVTEFDSYQHVPGGIAMRHRLRFEPATGEPITVGIEQSLVVAQDEPRRGFDWTARVQGLGEGQVLRMQLLPPSRISEAGTSGAGVTDRQVSSDGRLVRLPGVANVEIRAAQDCPTTIDADGGLRLVADGDGEARFALRLRTTLPVDQFLVLPAQIVESKPLRLNVVPGFEAVRLPLTDEIMPTAFAWRPDGKMVFTSLKGRVWLAHDRDEDGLEETLHCVSDELATPFGVAAGDGYLDVINKYALLRLHDDDGDDRADRVETLASGWGHTTDYHDWAVGLPADGQGGYYVGTACQQDKRSLEAAHWRGRVLQLVPRSPTDDDPRPLAVREVSGGHRFPIGIARRRDGHLFVSDNQGNYNPFNELNHVVPGARYGFLNTVERRPDFQPPLTAPAVNIPHPWTRSVNGICFLETPQAVRSRTGQDAFGPFEGHLIGCEYDTRRLIRISLQQVDGEFQGAAYPFSYDEPPEGEPLQGPLACGVSPGGDLVVGCIRDSGWGGANNVGSIVRLRPDLSRLPAGLAEVQATSDGFRLRFTRPVAAERAGNPDNYRFTSYTRESTPAYGGPDLNRREEKIQRVTVSDDRHQVDVVLGELRAGYVYEIRLKDLAEAGQAFFPAEAHYSLNRIP